MDISRQIRRAQERAKQKDDAKLAKHLKLSDFRYVADDKNMTYAAGGPQIIDFVRVTGLERSLREHVQIDKRHSVYRSETLSQLLVLQNILGYGRIENSRRLDQDMILKAKLGLERYPDPETFRDELEKYTEENIGQLFLVNEDLLHVLTLVAGPQEVDLHYDAKVITVYGDQEKAEVGYNPHKNGRKSYLMKVCTMEPFGFIVAIRLESGDSVSATDFLEFHRQCLNAVPQDHFVVRTVRLDRGFFGEHMIESFAGDCLFFEVVAKQYASLKRWIAAIPEKDFEEFYPDGSVNGASFSFALDSWEHSRDFIVVRKRISNDSKGQTYLFPQWRYQVICHNQIDMSPKEVWEDYNQRAKIELTIRDLQYDHFITKVPTGRFMSNFAYFWHGVLAFNLLLVFKTFVLTGEWKNARTSTLRQELIAVPGRLVNLSGQMVMRLMAGFPHAGVMSYVKERLLWLYRCLHLAPA
jgi:hypothetical protein